MTEPREDPLQTGVEWTSQTNRRREPGDSRQTMFLRWVDEDQGTCPPGGGEPERSPNARDRTAQKVHSSPNSGVYAVTLFGNRDFAGVFSTDETTLPPGGCNPVTGTPIRRGPPGTHAEVRKPCERQAEMGAMWPRPRDADGHPRTQAERALPLWGAQPCPPLTSTSDPQTVKE